jgi:hypothetical protein
MGLSLSANTRKKIGKWVIYLINWQTTRYPLTYIYRLLTDNDRPINLFFSPFGDNDRSIEQFISPIDCNDKPIYPKGEKNRLMGLSLSVKRR